MSELQAAPPQWQDVDPDAWEVQFHREECRDCGAVSTWDRDENTVLEWVVGHRDKHGHLRFYEYTITRRRTSVRRNGVF